MNFDKFGRYRLSNQQHRYEDYNRRQLRNPLFNKLALTEEGDISVRKCRIRDIVADNFSMDTDAASIRYVQDQGDIVLNASYKEIDSTKAELYQYVKSSVMEISTKLDEKIKEIEEKMQLLSIEDQQIMHRYETITNYLSHVKLPYPKKISESQVSSLNVLEEEPIESDISDNVE